MTIPSNMGYIMIVYKDYITFIVLGQEINLITGDTDYGSSTVAEINNKYYYLGETIPNLDTAIKGWHQANSRTLTVDEFNQVINDNNLDNIKV